MKSRDLWSLVEHLSSFGSGLHSRRLMEGDATFRNSFIDKSKAY